MGAVFAVFMGIYHWCGIMTGSGIQDKLGYLHFALLFLGVNITFFPQHFLGLAGMPRRIPDYPDAFIAWNVISSYGSIVSLLGVLVFLYLLWDSQFKKNHTAVLSELASSSSSFFQSRKDFLYLI